jgi:hypothetical protein
MNRVMEPLDLDHRQNGVAGLRLCSRISSGLATNIEREYQIRPAPCPAGGPVVSRRKLSYNLSDASPTEHQKRKGSVRCIRTEYEPSQVVVGEYEVARE